MQPARTAIRESWAEPMLVCGTRRNLCADHCLVRKAKEMKTHENAQLVAVPVDLEIGRTQQGQAKDRSDSETPGGSERTGDQSRNRNAESRLTAEHLVPGITNPRNGI
jgi:hypothetical protein